MKIVVLVLASDEVCRCGRCTRAGRESSYTEMVSAVRNTWAAEAEKIGDIKVYYIYGHRKGVDFPPDSKHRDVDETWWPDGGPQHGFSPQIVTNKRRPFAIDDCIYSDTPETRQNIYYKTIDGFEWLLENEDFDYILRSNCGTYMDLYLLREYVEKLGKRDDVYAGRPGIYNNAHNPTQPDAIKFVSGSALLASRKLIENLVQNRASVDHVRSKYVDRTVVDDITFAKHFVYDCGAQIIPWEKADVTSVSQISSRLKNKMQCYFCHTIDTELMYGVHEAKGLSTKRVE